MIHFLYSIHESKISNKFLLNILCFSIRFLFLFFLSSLQQKNTNNMAILKWFWVKLSSQIVCCESKCYSLNSLLLLCFIVLVLACEFPHFLHSIFFRRAFFIYMFMLLAFPLVLLWNATQQKINILYSSI